MKAPNTLKKKLIGNGSEAYLFAVVKAAVKALPYAVDLYYKVQGFPTLRFTGPPQKLKKRIDGGLALNIGTPIKNFIANWKKKRRNNDLTIRSDRVEVRPIARAFHGSINRTNVRGCIYSYPACHWQGPPSCKDDTVKTYN